MSTFNISIQSLRSAKVTNTTTGMTATCKVEPYHRNGKPMAYVVMAESLEAPIKRYNIKDFTGPVELKNVDLSNRGRNRGSDWSFWGKDKK